jgi:hypothetical protein
MTYLLLDDYDEPDEPEDFPDLTDDEITDMIDDYRYEVPGPGFRSPSCANHLPRLSDPNKF